MRWLPLLILLTLHPALADDRTNATHLAHGADGVTTLVGIGAAGATELNPLALPMLPISIYLTEKERGKCSDLLAGYQAVRWGAAANNVTVIAFGVAAFPWSLGLLPLVGVPVWNREHDKVVDCKVAVLKEVFAMGAVVQDE